MSIINQYIEVTRAFYEANNGYKKGNLIFNCGITDEGKYICHRNSFNEFPELFPIGDFPDLHANGGTITLNQSSVAAYQLVSDPNPEFFIVNSLSLANTIQDILAQISFGSAGRASVGWIKHPTLEQYAIHIPNFSAMRISDVAIGDDLATEIGLNTTDGDFLKAAVIANRGGEEVLLKDLFPQSVKDQLKTKAEIQVLGFDI